MAGIEKVATGQVVEDSALHQASVVNDILAATLDYKQRELGNKSSGRQLNRMTDLVTIKNVSGDDCVQGECLQIGDHLLTDIDIFHPWFEADTPASPLIRCAIVHRALPDDAIGEAHVSGRCVARVNFTDTTHKFANPEAGNTILQSGTSGMFEILGPAPGSTGENETWVRFLHRHQIGHARYNDASSGAGSVQTIAASTTATVEFDTQIHNFGGAFTWDGADHDLTFSVAGLYCVSSIINMEADTTSVEYEFYAEKNAARILGAWLHNNHTAVQAYASLSFTEYFAAGDVLRFRLQAGSTSGGIDIYSEQGGNYPPRFDVFLVG